MKKSYALQNNETKGLKLMATSIWILTTATVVPFQ